MTGMITPDEPSPGRWQQHGEQWWMLTILFALYVISFIDRLIMSMMVAPIQASLGVSDVEIGLVLGPAFAICYAVFGFPLGWASDRYSRRWIIFGGSCVFGLATISIGLASSFAWLLLARMLVGIGEASLSPAAYSLMADRFPRHMLTTASSIYNTAAKVGTASAYIVGGALIAAIPLWEVASGRFEGVEPWRLVFFATGLPALLIACLVFTFREPVRKSHVAHKSSDSVVQYMRARLRLFVPLLLGFGAIGITSFSMTAWTPTFLTRTFGLTPAQFGPALGAISAASAFLLVFKGGVVDWLYARGMHDAHIRFYTWLLIAALPLSIGMFATSSSLVFMLLYGAVQVICLPAIAYMSAALQLIVPSHLRGQVIAIFLFVLTVAGGGIGPVLVSLLTEYVFGDPKLIGWSLGIVVCSSIPVALVFLRSALPALGREMIAGESAQT